MVATQGFDWQAHVRQLSETEGLYPGDIAYDVVDKLVSHGDISIGDEGQKEIAFTEALNYANRIFGNEGYEF
jgi:hypothetical protein